MSSPIGRARHPIDKSFSKIILTPAHSSGLNREAKQKRHRNGGTALALFPIGWRDETPAQLRTRNTPAGLAAGQPERKAKIMKTPNTPFEKHDDTTSVAPFRPTTTQSVFECEEGELEGRPVPIPGLIRSPGRHGHSDRVRDYTSPHDRTTAPWEPDLREARRGWTEEDGSATAMPGLIANPAVSVSLPVEQPPAVMGLCGSCELNATCTFPRPASGVWRCEEYQ